MIHQAKFHETSFTSFCTKKHHFLLPFCNGPFCTPKTTDAIASNDIMKVVYFTYPCQLYEGQSAHHTIWIGMKWIMVNLLRFEPSNSIRMVVALVMVMVFGNWGGQSTDTDTHNATDAITEKL